MSFLVVFWGSAKIEFTLVQSERKQITIKVYPDNRVEVFAPLHTSEEEILEKVRKKAPWILKQMNHFDSYKPITPKRRFVNGETHLYLGRQYRLKVVCGNESHIKAYRGQLLMYTKNTDTEVLEKLLLTWYKEKAIHVFNELLEETLPKFNRYNIQRPHITIRRMDKRWGSCSADGRIILNTELIKAPKGSIEYVIVHELCHLVHHNHTKAFQDLQNSIMPDWKKWKERLEYSLA